VLSLPLTLLTPCLHTPIPSWGAGYHHRAAPELGVGQTCVTSSLHEWLHEFAQSLPPSKVLQQADGGRAYAHPRVVLKMK
jgi:hypothetical protein